MRYLKPLPEPTLRTTQSPNNPTSRNSMNTLSRVGILSVDAEANLTKFAGSLLNLFLRCYVGWQFFKSGMLKVSDWNATLGLFQTEYHVPLLPPHVAAITGATGELLFPTLLFIGFVARPAALGLLFVN